MFFSGGSSDILQIVLDKLLRIVITADGRSDTTDTQIGNTYDYLTVSPAQTRYIDITVGWTLWGN